MNIWEVCDGAKHIAQVSGTIFRLVESQEQIATLGYVDTLEEQSLLEEMLEEVKPLLPVDLHEFHYLLKTPFRYPPLKWGSRFGKTYETGIFYGGKTPDVTLAESAYYRFIFWYSMDAEPIKKSIVTEHTLFTIDYRSNKGICLQNPPFNQHTSYISHPKDYSYSQALGTTMRNIDIELFEYTSARDLNKEICVGLFSPYGFVQKKPTEMSQWLCEINANEVSFKQHGQKKVSRFMRQNFLWNGELPFPA